MALKLKFLEGLNARWVEIPADKRRLIMYGGMVASFILIAAGVDSSPKDPQELKKAELAAAAAALKKMGPEVKPVTLVTPKHKDNVYDEMTAKLDATNKELSDLRGKTATTIDDVAKTRDAVNRRDGMVKSELSEQLKALNDEVKLLKSGVISGQPPGVGVPELNLPPPPGADVKPKPMAVEPPLPGVPAEPIVPAKKSLRIRTSMDSESSSGIEAAMGSQNSGVSAAKVDDSMKSSSINKKDQTPQKQFIPAGTIIEGVLLNGIDAPTHGVGQQNPVPSLMRVKADAIMPNRKSKDIKDCFILLSGYGELSTERAKLRTELLSCIGEDGGVIQAPLDGYVVDADGKAGLKGRVVSKQGQVIAKTLMAGTLAGIAQGLTPMQVPAVATNPGQSAQYQSPNLGTVGASGLSQGAANAANEVAKFYLEMAREMFPVIEINNLTPVTIILVKGASLSIGNVNALGSGRGSSR